MVIENKKSNSYQIQMYISFHANILLQVFIFSWLEKLCIFWTFEYDRADA